MTTISVIIRTYNEEKWIGECLRSLTDQTVEDFEVVLVDNQSTDKTVEKANSVYPDLTLVEIEDYLPGLALNEGIRVSLGEYFVCLSAHCIPVNEQWLEALHQKFKEYDDVAGVYGRQVPLESSDPVDKRDLFRMFGPEKRVQTRDTFFHNANSMIDRSVWKMYPFDEEVTNIEDQIWANEVQDEGYTIIYEPDAAVYHHHGINQGNDETRTRNVVQTMENNAVIDEDDLVANLDANPLDPAELDIVSFIPVRQRADAGVDADADEELIEETVQTTQAAEHVDNTFITTDSEEVAANTAQLDATEAILRPPELSVHAVDVVSVYKYTLEQLEESGRYPDLVVTLDITHPFRPPGFLDDVIEYLTTNGYDTVVPVYPESRPTWIDEDTGIKRLNKGSQRSNRVPVQIGLFSLGTVMYPHVLRRRDRLSGDLGLYEIENPLATIEIRSREDLRYWERIRDVPNQLEDK
jgi:CMP-N-acetylneuraminic acid synthetase